MTTGTADRFAAYLVERDEQGHLRQGVRSLTPGDLPPGEVTIRVAYSGVNYKDGLASRPDGRVVRSYPMVPGIDLAGKVVESADPRFRPGDPVLVTGYELGVSHYGGYAEYARVPGDWVVPLPRGLDLREAMILGTAGFTAALALHRLEEHGLAPGRGPVLVTGASGGVGSVAVAILARRGYEVVASTGKPEAAPYLERLGASRVIPRDEVAVKGGKPLEKQQWVAAIDAVGGDTLAHVLRTTRYGGAVAAVGLTGGSHLHTTVFPFILRGVSLLGIDSVYCPMPLRMRIWQRLAGDLRPEALEDLVYREVELAGLPGAFDDVLAGRVRGRILVRLR
ncbi:quinone oxidoreductase, YhdH/YhfP family [Thermaerobacter marianensis DSM 12885]|uniref:Quinone oxidoreductase, YhdH/YhfP family n=1 Tax=Thermaerobacter marianensis (strain ATCC 700841 / DSM 12885 / JCM 10246 / 7p75a) TaxID=644966 RepID=E6SJ67_THEM7|nr:acryloyl-CoA reductase [Thermaerobacter marianensis]ADU52091.1 quinone oxidoreductase, YhdH/YhfP family [Thermaerobacter marianensis DSM 12885]